MFLNKFVKEIFFFTHKHFNREKISNIKLYTFFLKYILFSNKFDTNVHFIHEDFIIFKKYLLTCISLSCHTTDILLGPAPSLMAGNVGLVRVSTGPVTLLGPAPSLMGREVGLVWVPMWWSKWDFLLKAFLQSLHTWTLSLVLSFTCLFKFYFRVKLFLHWLQIWERRNTWEHYKDMLFN